MVKRHKWQKFGCVNKTDVCERCNLRREHRITHGRKVFGNSKRHTLVYFRGAEYLGTNIFLPTCEV